MCICLLHPRASVDLVICSVAEQIALASKLKINGMYIMGISWEDTFGKAC